MKRIIAFILAALVLTVALVSCEKSPTGQIVYTELRDGYLWATYSGDPDEPVCLGWINGATDENVRRILTYRIIDGYLWVTYDDAPGEPESVGELSADYTYGNGGATDKTHTESVSVIGSNGRFQWEYLDFDNAELTVLVPADERLSREWEREEVGDDKLDIAILNRNEVVEGELELDVKIRPISRTKIAETALNDVQNKLHNIDIVANVGFSGMTAELRDSYANLLAGTSSNEELFPYFNFKLKCWNQSIIENGTVNEQLYAVAGDLNLSMLDSISVIWHNVDLYEKLRNDEDEENLQDLTIAEGWTYSDLYRWASYCPENAPNGYKDGKKLPLAYGIYVDREDTAANPAAAIPVAWELDTVSANEDGLHGFSSTDFDDALNKVRQLYLADGNIYNAVPGGSFSGGDVLFKCDVIFADEASNRAIREMEDVYAILPIPKYDQEQDSHHATCTGDFNTVSVLDHSNSAVATKFEEVSAYIQYANEYTYTHVRGYYFERIIKPRFYGTDDSDGYISKSVTIFYILISNLEFDFATIYSPMLNNAGDIFKQAALDGVTVSDAYEESKSAYDNAFAELDQWFGLSN